MVVSPVARLRHVVDHDLVEVWRVDLASSPPAPVPLHPAMLRGMRRLDLRKRVPSRMHGAACGRGIVPAAQQSCPNRCGCPARWTGAADGSRAPPSVRVSILNRKGYLMTGRRVDVVRRGVVRRVADFLPDADRRADWRPARALFQQLVQLVDSGSPHIPDELCEAFADAIGKIAASYAGHEALLSEHALAILADVEGGEILDRELFRAYYEDDRFNSAPGVRSASRRRPAPYEAMVETCRRLRDARSLRVACRNTVTSGLPVGSTSYGRFYNIRGNRGGVGPRRHHRH
jgi:hypothetical protein